MSIGMQPDPLLSIMPQQQRFRCFVLDVDELVILDMS